jgi:hypothetical protein
VGVSATARPERVTQGTLVLDIGPDRLTLRDSWEGAAPFALAAAVGAALAGAAARWRPAGWAVGLCAAGTAVLALGAWGLARGRVPHMVGRHDRTVTRGPRRLGSLAGVYVQSGTGPGGDWFSLFLRLDGRPARQVRTDDRRDALQYVGMKLAAVVGVTFHQGPGRPK